MSELLWEPPEGISVEASLDYYALRSRYTATTRPQDHPEIIEQVANMLDGLTEAQRAAAETMGFASLNAPQAAKVLGKSNPHTVRLSWYRTVEKFTGQTPPPLESVRERKRRQRANNPPKPRQRKYDGDERERARQRQKAWRANLYRIERETGVTPPALAALRERKREQRRRSREM